MHIKTLPWLSIIATLILHVYLPSAQAGYVLTKSTLESCGTSGGLTTDTCDQRLVVLYSVANGQNNTDTIQLMIDEVEGDEEGQISNADVTLQIQKTPIYFQYPTAYHKTYNYQAWELVAYGTTDTDGVFTYFNDNPLNFQVSILPLISNLLQETSPFCPIRDHCFDNLVRNDIDSKFVRRQRRLRFPELWLRN